MKSSFVVCVLTMALAARPTGALNPIQQVLQMISDLQAKVINEGKDVQKVYDEVSEWCEDQSKESHFEIKTGKSQVEELKAIIADTTAKIDELGAKIEELGGSVALNEKELKEANKVRNGEHKTFAAEEKELVESIDMIERAYGILEKELNGGASFAQLKGSRGLIQALTALSNAHALNTAEATHLTALVQSSSDDGEEATGAPEAAAYEGKSGAILDVLEDMKSKAEDQLASIRKAETTAANNFDLLVQSLNDEIKFAKADFDAAKKGVAENSERKATAEGDLDTTTKDLASDVKSLEDLHHDCMEKADVFEEETKSRAEELSALAEAKKIIKEATSGAAKQSYDLAQVSFLQVTTQVKDLSAAMEVAHALRRLANTQRSSALAQLANRVEVVSRQGGDVFAKIKGLIADMIDKLEDAAAADATKKARCDKELGETNAKKDDKEAEKDKLTTKMDQNMADSAKLKEEVATLQKELAALANGQKEADDIREKEKAVYDKNRPEMEQGLAGIKAALKVLRDYYAKDAAHGSSGGAASGIIGLLEVAESDFSKGLSEMITEEERAVKEHTDMTNENEVTRATKEQDVKYKTKESKSLDKKASDLQSDLGTLDDELSAVYDYLKQLRSECVPKAETYEERKARREAEIAGLKEALEILSSQASLMQVDSGSHVGRLSLRGSGH